MANFWKKKQEVPFLAGPLDGDMATGPCDKIHEHQMVNAKHFYHLRLRGKRGYVYVYAGYEVMPGSVPSKKRGKR